MASGFKSRHPHQGRLQGFAVKDVGLTTEAFEGDHSGMEAQQ